MTVELLSIEEAAPAAWPDPPSGTFTVSNETIWRRLEGWTRYRFALRQVVWTVEGPGLFVPTLRPFALVEAEAWIDDTWTATTLTPWSVGYRIPVGQYRIAGTVGEPDSAASPPKALPADLAEAYRRLGYFLDEAGADPAKGLTAGRDGDYSFRRSEGWAAKAIHLSGAADLLRTYR